MTAALLDRLHHGSVDLAIVSLPVPGNDLHGYQLFEEQFYAVLPESHALAKRKQVSLAQLNGQRFLVLKQGHCFRHSLFSARREAGANPRLPSRAASSPPSWHWCRREWESLAGAGHGPAPACRVQLCCHFRQAQHPHGRYRQTAPVL